MPTVIANSPKTNIDVSLPKATVNVKIPYSVGVWIVEPINVLTVVKKPNVAINLIRGI